MDSSPFHQPGDLHRMPDGLHPHALHPVHHRAAVQKRTTAPRNRSISSAQLDRLHNYALEQANSSNSASLPSPSVTAQWITPQPSPQPQLFPDASTVDAFTNWAVPTPPRSDSGVPNVTFDSSDIPVTAGITASDFEQFQQSATASEMRSVVLIHHSLLHSLKIAQFVGILVTLAIRIRHNRVRTKQYGLSTIVNRYFRC